MYFHLGFQSKFRCIVDAGCYFGDGFAYKGYLNITEEGLPCQRWDAQFPHEHDDTDAENFPDDSLSDANNYCRNPDSDERPWCFTTDPEIRWQFCHIEPCSK